MKTVFAMVGTHSAFTKAAKSHFTGCQVDDGVIDTSASESTAVIIPGLFEPPVRTLRATIPENESHIFR